jgi:catechol 2,3-dioxygenase-like lactoylglutathione lyase family enzyme
MDEFVKGLVWVGTRTEYFEEMVAFYRDTLRLSLHHEEGEFAIFRLPDGSKAEVFGPSDTEHTHFSTGPVAGFLVDDVDGARKKNWRREESSSSAPSTSGNLWERPGRTFGPLTATSTR